MKNIGIGVIGWGFMGRAHTFAIKTMPLHYELDFMPRLVGVCSRRLEQAQRAAQEQGFCYATDDYRRLLADPEIDVVSICTPNQLHEEMALAAIAAGKHVYIDKPVSISYASARRIADAARAAGVSAQVALNNRFFPATMKAHELISSGRLGRVTSFSVEYLHSGSVDPDRPIGWKQQADENGGGVLLDLGSHALDLSMWLCGDAEWVDCAAQTLYSERPTADGGRTSALGEDRALMLLGLRGGAVGSVDASKIATGTDDELNVRVYLTGGAVRYSSLTGDYLDVYDCALGAGGYTHVHCGGRYPAPGGSFIPPKNAVGWIRSHVHCYYSFLDAVCHGGQCSPSLDEGARLQLVMERAYESSRKGGRVAI
ncbi:MAG: Gfo/Idh/MocA family protein [Candidatus Fimadaptatus sp.]